MPETPLRVGVIGLGAISRFYLAALESTPSLRLAAVCDRHPEALSPLRDRVPCYLDHREMLAGGGLDAAVVSAPNHMHAPLCRDVLAAGLPVCVEKPLAILPADGDALRAEARLRGVTLFTAFHRRYNLAVRALADRLPQGVPVAEVRVRYLERIEDHIGRDAWYLDPARSGGGCVADNGPNAFDLARMLLGELSVAEAHIARDREAVDRRAAIGLRSEGGATASVELDWSYPGELKDVRVRLADGSTDSADMLGGFPGFKSSLWHEYRGVLGDFASRLRAPRPRDDDGGPAALALVDAAYRSECRARPGGEPVAGGNAHDTEGGGR
ncbi:Gfo/Idh/MocA family protein [Streptomonospora wellingtoniae]|uniref:Gfo/Idh/MocA family oxidoreductase n=1 Tax=Streptomonospora wellingtoniae TaxID=3075544 RepID=A0ABU2KQD1_9ACTN|nr:Gfo/Idh/MocA family oxidoreductase [Streptomonospora sp. DSM 45055]MDT0301421.1 Gfo/Idh/MocA family oxidoreductase [Streptomonospora sp. DSM 45055]